MFTITKIKRVLIARAPVQCVQYVHHISLKCLRKQFHRVVLLAPGDTGSFRHQCPPSLPQEPDRCVSQCSLHPSGENPMLTISFTVENGNPVIRLSGWLIPNKKKSRFIERKKGDR